MSCLDLATLVDYWAHALAPDAVERAEEHLFDCDRCAQRSESVRALADGVAQVVRRRGGLVLSLTESLVERLGRDGIRMRHHRVKPGERIACTVGADEDLLVTWLDVPRVDGRLDLARYAPDGTLLARTQDLPTDPSGRVIYALPAEAAREWPTMEMEVHAIAVEPSGERVVARYLFDHTAFKP
jgi:hypothetical protein